MTKESKEINWELLRQAYECTEMTLKEVAEKHSVNLSTLKNKKSRDTKKGDPWKKVAKVATKSRKVAKVAEKDSAKPTSNQKTKTVKRRSGNPNPQNQFTARNQAGLKHGMYSKHIPQEVLSIMRELDEMLPVDMIWQQILMQHASIIRAQEIMFVSSREDMTRELKRQKNGKGEDNAGAEVEYELQFAWDKHASFMTAQTRAISELRSLISKFVQIADEHDERRLKLEIMGLQSQKLRKEIEPDTSTEDKLSGYFTALQDAFKQPEKKAD